VSQGAGSVPATSVRDRTPTFGDAFIGRSAESADLVNLLMHEGW
jgi:hypothetical protein